MATISASLAAYAGDAVSGGKYAFDGKIAREVLENYLARSLLMLGLADSKQFNEDLRMIRNVGAKQLGRVACIWWAGDAKANVEAHVVRAKTAADRLHKMDPELMLQACIFETVGKGANEIPIPAWVFEEFGQKPEARAFRCESMGYDDGWQGHGHGCIPPDMSKLETKMWFYYWGRRYIDCGYENIHLGMIGHMDRKDPGHVNWFDTLGRLRRYAARHARRHMVLFDSQLRGIAEDGKLLLDYHNMVLRPKIDWFARQPEAYRNEWLRYAWDWIRKNDPNGYLQMQGSKCLNPSDVRGAPWYYANTKSESCPNGFNQEETIMAIWNAVPNGKEQ